MRIPRSDDFALLVMSELAVSFGKRLESLSTIGEKHHISKLFLKKIARTLKIAGLIKSKEGADGGYVLAYPPEKITVWDIMQALSAKSYHVPALVISRKACPINHHCLPQNIRHTLDQTFAKSLGKVYLSDLVKNEKLYEIH